VSGSVKLVPKSFGCTEFILAAALEHRAAFSLSSSGVTGPRTSAAGAVTSAVRGVAASFANSRGTVAKVDPESTSGVTGPRTSAAGAVASAVRGVLAGGAASFTTSRDTDANVDPESTTSRDEAGVILSFLAAAAPRLHGEFARYEEVDKATLEHFVKHGVEEAPESSEREKALVLRRLQDDDQDSNSWSRLAGTVREPVSYFKKVDEDSNTWGKAEGVVDTSAPDVLAWLWHSCTHERNLEAVKGGWVELKSTSPFVSLSMQYTEPEEGGSSVALGKAESTLDCSATEAFAYQFAVCGREKLRISREGGDRARFILKEHTKHDFELAVVKKAPFPLTNREYLNRYLSFKEPTGDIVLVFEALPDITTVDYGANLKVVRGKTTAVYRFKPTNDDTQCEVSLVQHGDAGGFVPKRIVVAKIPQALGSVGNMRELFQRDDAIDGAKISELAAIIKCVVDAPIAEVAAWELAKMSRENMKEHVAFGGLDRDLVRINDHQDIYHVVYDLSIPTFLPRRFVSRVVWKWEEDKKELTVVYDDVKHTAFPECKEYLRASATGMSQYKQEADVGKIPQTKLRNMDAYDKSDGRALGYRLTYPDEKNKKTPSEAVAHIVELHKGLSQLSQEHPWIVAFLEEVLLGGLHRNKAVSTKLDCLSEAEARKIGKNLPGALRARKQASGGVYQWKNQNPSMVELFEKYPWVEEMVETMGEELLKNAAWGLWFRVITGSGLSMVDLATDINVIRVYFGEEGQEGYGWMMLGMVLASMGLQLLMVLVQNGKMGWGKLMREALIVVSGLKPGVDAMRVVSNAEMHEHHLFDAKLELMATKGIEMFCESIPGCILQVYALIQGGSEGQMGTKVLSIVVSAITTGMGSASISYDFDSDPEERRKLPSFYGYLPDEGNARTIMYVCMVLNSALLLLLRSIGAALLMLADTKIFVAYMAGDHLLYLLQKLVRGDFLYWAPVEGVAGLAVSLLMRVSVKTVTDFTGVIQLRGP
ncbi:hypothetical protein TeGR_g7371, partial [Tetraparma gracilis]